MEEHSVVSRKVASSSLVASAIMEWRSVALSGVKYRKFLRPVLRGVLLGKVKLRLVERSEDMPMLLNG